jgi:mono/diheme cytochrome c family protein
MTGLARILVTASIASVPAVLLASTVSAEGIAPAQQNALVRKYCAVCHTDKTNNGGLSLEHYDAARVDPPLAAMLLSKLRNGAMGAAGLGIPDPETREAWVAATVAQAAGADQWTVTRPDRPSATAPSCRPASSVKCSRERGRKMRRCTASI